MPHGGSKPIVATLYMQSDSVVIIIVRSVIVVRSVVIAKYEVVASSVIIARLQIEYGSS